jgi:hypothetical protein
MIVYFEFTSGGKMKRILIYDDEREQHIFMKHPIETVKKLASEKIKLVGADNKVK